MGVTGDDLFAEILMLRTADPRTIVLLEGASDCQALDTHIDAAVAHTLPGYAKTTVERAIELADSGQVQRVLAIVDLDWVGVLSGPLESANVVYTDHYDLDATVFLSDDIMTRVVATTTDRDRLDAYLTRVGSSLREIVVRMAGKIGLGRFVSCRDRLEVPFRDFPTHVAITQANDDVDLAQMVTIALGRSREPMIQQTEFLGRVKKTLNETGDLSRYCSGHDIAAVLAHLVRHCLGGGALSRQTMEQFGRAALSCAALKQTALYGDVVAWAREANTRVWSCE
jgi:hypothetical protein